MEEKPEWKKENSWHYTNDVFGSDQDGDGNDGNYDGDKDNDYTDTNNADNGSESAENRDDINKDPDGIADTAKGGSEMGHIYVDYAFSEQALGLVSAIEDWSLLRWIMANHLQDVASEIDNLEAGKKVYYAHFLANKTDRDPAGRSPLGLSLIHIYPHSLLLIHKPGGF